MTRRCGLMLLVGLVLVAGCGEKPKESLTKRAARSVTNKALDAVDGVTEAIAERGQKSAQAASKAAGELAAGVAEGARESMDVHGQAIGSNIVSAAAPVLISAGQAAVEQAKAPAATNLMNAIESSAPKQ